MRGEIVRPPELDEFAFAQTSAEADEKEIVVLGRDQLAAPQEPICFVEGVRRDRRLQRPAIAPEVLSEAAGGIGIDHLVVDCPTEHGLERVPDPFARLQGQRRLRADAAHFLQAFHDGLAH